MALPADPRSPEESPPQPHAAQSEETVFLAPFASASFLRAVSQEMALRRILRERTSAILLIEKTGLVWMTQDNGRDIDWRRASDYCTRLELAGFDDWRLPTLQELEDLMQPLSKRMYSTPREINLTACCVWSSTTKNDVSAWNFNYRFSKRFSGSLTHTYELRALCVRAWREEDGWLPDEDAEAAVPELP